MTSPRRSLDELVADNRPAVLAGWMERILAACPPETARFLRDTSDRFGNPVGAALREELPALLDGVLGRVDDERLRASLDRIVRVRAVQGLAPSAAVSFLFDLKPILEQLLESAGGAARDELALLDRRVDRVALVAFDVYSICREQVCEIRVRSIRELSMKHLERLGEWQARRDGRPATADAEEAMPPERSDEWAP
ncbi:MAG TPA: RsbRD N-terminal domain-containing protein [Thermoanaerobaculales bacterium]|nr:RsbRD N-terminal domain-containing protein [Thermoanaerobaculales bacterium]HPA79909.1 RsbRD N-terminal domain-containing protein [Thermoanaerobaculales bacterium]HQL31416.1 RsbRD N-terminal domain-containing protein [Thermoanaerobaculales bacterium]HQN96984.1 RsbRD N-terminal domain-containing protein [Thermoanaerobaculales bacterium]HQP42545.1 RsbRD N-terminal domain-containing protein [Thermoanaerobaculales bacterium]